MYMITCIMHITHMMHNTRHKILLLVLMLNVMPSLSLQCIPKLCMRPPHNAFNVQKYISNNRVSPFVLFTILNSCCQSIMIYHNIINKYHGNTTLNNFYMYDTYECVLLEPIIKNQTNTLTKVSAYEDFIIFFISCRAEFGKKNKHFLHILNNYISAFLESVFNLE